MKVSTFKATNLQIHDFHQLSFVELFSLNQYLISIKFIRWNSIQSVFVVIKSCTLHIALQFKKLIEESHINIYLTIEGCNFYLSFTKMFKIKINLSRNLIGPSYCSRWPNWLLDHISFIKDLGDPLRFFALLHKPS